MIAARTGRGRDKPRARLVLLLVMVLLGVGFALADDIDFPDILTPGGGGDQTGGNSGKGEKNGPGTPLELYLENSEGSSFTLEEQGAVQGLVFSEKLFELEARLLCEGDTTDPESPNPRALLVAHPGAQVTAGRGEDALLFEGDFDLYVKLPTLLQGFELFLAPSEEARLVVTVVRFSHFPAGASGDDLADWVLNGPDGEMQTFTDTGPFPLSKLLRAVFIADPGVTRIGLLQTEYDEAGNVTACKTMEMERDSEIPDDAGTLGPALEGALLLRFHMEEATGN